MTDDKNVIIIMGQSYSIDGRNVATPLAYSVDQERQWHDKPESRPPEYLMRDGVGYRIYDDAKAYADALLDGGAKIYTGHKSACVFAEYDPDKNNWLVKAVDSNGDIRLDANGNESSWRISDKVFKAKYDVDNISSRYVVSPRRLNQSFVRVDKNVAIPVAWGENGSTVYQALGEGDCLNVTDFSDIYGVPVDELARTYSFDGQPPMARRSIEAIVSAAAAAEIGIQKNIR